MEGSDFASTPARNDPVDDRSTYFIPERLSRMHLDPVAHMAKLNMAIDHGQTREMAQSNFERAISAAQERFGKWIHRAEWSAEPRFRENGRAGFRRRALVRRQAKFTLESNVPLAFRLMEVPIKAFIKQTLASE